MIYLQNCLSRVVLGLLCTLRVRTKLLVEDNFSHSNKLIQMVQRLIDWMLLYVQVKYFMHIQDESIIINDDDECWFTKTTFQSMTCHLTQIYCFDSGTTSLCYLGQSVFTITVCLVEKQQMPILLRQGIEPTFHTITPRGGPICTK